MTDYTEGLHEVAPDVWAWLAPDGTWGWSNAGLVAGRDESIVFDTLYDLSLTAEMLEAMQLVTDERPIIAAVNSHPDGDHCYGNELLPASAPIYAGRHFDHEAHETPPQALAALMRNNQSPYIAEWFSAFDFEPITLRLSDVVVEERTRLDVGGRDVTLIPFPPAHSGADVVMFVPDAGVLFAGDLLFIGGTPIMWGGPTRNWVAACDEMLALEPTVVVPGHGPLTDMDGIAQVRDYLTFVDLFASEAFNKGRTWREAAFDIDLGRFASLTNPERVVGTIYTIYRHLDPSITQHTNIDLIDVMSQWRDARSGDVS